MLQYGAKFRKTWLFFS